MNGTILKTSLLSFGLVGLLGGSAQAAEVDVFGGQTFCEFHHNYALETIGSRSASSELLHQIEQQFADKYVQGLRSGELERPSVAPLLVPLSEGGQVVVYSPAPGLLAVSGDVAASIGTLRLDSAQYQGLRLDLVGSGSVTIDESVSALGLKELYVFSHGTDLSIDMRATAPCALVDGGREQAAGPLKLDTSSAKLPVGDDGYTIACVQNLYGTTGADTMHGNGCNDNMYGRDGNDTMFGYTGRDYMMGEGASDKIYGNEGGDCLVPGLYTGVDYLYGGQDDDFIFQGNGTDYCYGDLGNDVCSGACEFRSSCETVTFNMACYAN